MIAYIPSPPINGVNLGPLRLHVYGLMIAIGIIVAVKLAQREYSRIGGRPGAMAALAVWGVPGGLIGARAYSMVTSWPVNTAGAHGFWGHVWACFEVWHGGLGIWGGIVGGVATGLWGAHRMGMSFAPLLDSVAPAFPVAQAIGRVGNYFNQELYGWRSNLPWAVRIAHPQVCNSLRCHNVAPGTFQPTFLYEGIWDLITAVIVLWVGRRFRIRRGYLIAVYASTYTFGRFFTEYMRIDEARRYFGLRINDWMSIFVCLGGLLVVLLRGRFPNGPDVARAPIALHDGGPQAATVATAVDAPVGASASAGAGEAQGSPGALTGPGPGGPAPPPDA